MKHKIFMMVGLIALSSCMKLKKKDDENNPTPTAQNQVQPVPPVQVDSPKADAAIVKDRTEFTYSYQIDEKKYLSQVLFLAPINWPTEIIVQKADGDSHSQTVALFNNQGEWKDFLTSVNKVSYKFYSKVSQELVLLDEVEVLPVLELSIKEDFNLAQKYSLNSKTKIIYIKDLQMTEQMHLYIEDYAGKIIIQNYNSSNGFIQTFSDESRALDGKDGRSGGTVDLDILSGKGFMNVIMQGENGGDGIPAKLPDVSLKGAVGAQGQPADFAQTASTVEGGFDNYRCSKDPTNGMDGGRGLKGFNGNSGKNGGNSGSVTIINKAQDIKIFLNSIEGRHGKGSQGGLGGEGGDGGFSLRAEIEQLAKKLGINTCYRLDSLGLISCQGYGFTIVKDCVRAQPGRQGERGDYGDPGRDGRAGNKQSSCLYVQDQKAQCLNE